MTIDPAAVLKAQFKHLYEPPGPGKWQDEYECLVCHSIGTVPKAVQHYENCPVDALSQQTARVEALHERVAFEVARRTAEAPPNDYTLACYMLRDTRVAEHEGMTDLLWALHHSAYASKADWEHVRDAWDAQYRKDCVMPLSEGYVTDIRDAEPQPPYDSGGYCCVSAGMHEGHDEDCPGYACPVCGGRGWEGELTGVVSPDGYSEEVKAPCSCCGGGGRV